MAETATLEPPKQKKPGIDYTLATGLIASGLTYDEVAPKVGASSGNSLKVCMFKRGLRAEEQRELTIAATRTTTILRANVATEQSQELKSTMASVLQKHVNQLAKLKGRANLTYISRIAGAMEPLARIAKIVHGWGDESQSGLIAFGVVEQLNKAACGVQTPTDTTSPQDNQDNQAQTPQDNTQPIDVTSVVASPAD